MYIAVEISNEKGSEIIGQSKDWVQFAENHHGEVYWNKTTGEIIWLANEEGDSNYQQLIKDMKKTIPAVPETLISITCDCCKQEYNDIGEMQEFLSHNDTCGYYNKTFGDETKWSIDLCQHCVKLLLGQYIQIEENNEI